MKKKSPKLSTTPSDLPTVRSPMVGDAEWLAEHGSISEDDSINWGEFHSAPAVAEEKIHTDMGHAIALHGYQSAIPWNVLKERLRRLNESHKCSHIWSKSTETDRPLSNAILEPIRQALRKKGVSSMTSNARDGESTFSLDALTKFFGE